MTQAAFERGDWQAVIHAHPLESHDPQEWLRYGVALLQTITPGVDVGKQQQQAALAFVQAKKEGAPVEAIAAAQRQAVGLSLAEALNLAGLTATVDRVERQMGRQQKNLTALEQINTHLRLHHWIEAVEKLESLSEQELTPLAKRQAEERALHAILQTFQGSKSSTKAHTYAELNEHRQADEPLPVEAEGAFEATARLSPATPLILIENSSKAKELLTDTPYWIAYGNVRTGSTMVFNLLRILANSLTDQAMSAWEGDFASPEKFFGVIEESQGIRNGVLKIHRNHEAVNQRLMRRQAKAVLTHRNMRDCCYSYWRMLSNPASPFFQKYPQLSRLEEFLKNEIRHFQAKTVQPNTLVIKEEHIRNDTEETIQQISTFLELSIHPTSRKFLAEYLSTNNLAKLANTGAQSKNTTGHERVTFLHPNHISTQRSVNSCSEEVKQEIERLLNGPIQNHLDENAYILPYLDHFENR
jgi:hypothetical protein